MKNYIVHVEFRGYDGLPNPDKNNYLSLLQALNTNKDITGFGAVIEMQMLTYYIEDLCDEFVKAFYHFTGPRVSLGISESVESVAMNVVSIMQNSSAQGLTPEAAFYKILEVLNRPNKQKYLQATHEVCSTIAPHLTLFTHILLHYVKHLTIEDVLDLLQIAEKRTWNLSKRYHLGTQTL